MILVTLGTQDKEFSRLVEEIDRLVKNKIIKDEVIVQAGCTKYESDSLKILKLIPQNEFNDLIKKCDLLITHGGVGSILTGIQNNKKVIAVPRLKKYGEHESDHQIQIVEEFSDRGYIVGINDIKKLSSAIEKIKDFNPKKYVSNNKKMVKLIDDYISKEEDKKKIKKDKNKNVSVPKEKRKLIYKNKTKNPILLFWNWGWNIYYDNQEFWNYIIVGVICTIVNTFIRFFLRYTILQGDGLDLQLSVWIAWCITVVIAYVLNRIIVFKSKSKNIFKEFVSFVNGRIATLLMDSFLTWFFITFLGFNTRLLEIIFYIIIQIIVIVVNYLLSKVFVFKKEE